MKLNRKEGRRKAERQREKEKEREGGKGKEHPNLFLVFVGCSLQGHPERLACNYSVLIEDNEPDI